MINMELYKGLGSRLKYEAKNLLKDTLAILETLSRNIFVQEMFNYFNWS